MNKIRVALIEDHDLTRIGLQAALPKHGNIQIVAEATNGRDGLKALRTALPDVALVDIGLPEMDGIELTRRFKEFQATSGSLHTKVMMLTMHDNEEDVLAAFAAGADSYSIKDAGIDRLVEAIQVTNQGDNWIDPSVARIVLRQNQDAKSGDRHRKYGETTMIGAVDPEYERIIANCSLTEKELEVLELIVAGHSNAEIAKKLYVTVGTVKTHVRSILNKLCADDRTQAAVRALRAGLVR
ncbi:MAG: response regulator [Elainellaceae cyanobacterium]